MGGGGVEAGGGGEIGEKKQSSKCEESALCIVANAPVGLGDVAARFVTPARDKTCQILCTACTFCHPGIQCHNVVTNRADCQPFR